MDNSGDTDRSVGAGAGEQLHDGRFCSHPARHCHNSYYFRVHRRTKIVMTKDSGYYFMSFGF